MGAKREYDLGMRRRNGVVVAGFVVVCLLAGSSAVAQIHGVPASVTSIGFGGQWNQTPGVPASVTSLGPNGFHPTNPFITQPFIPSTQNLQGHHHGGFPATLPVYGYGYGYGYAPYAPVVVMDQPVMEVQPEGAEVEEEQYNGGPTIFDRRGPGPGAPYAQGQYPPERYPQERSSQERQPGKDDRYAGTAQRDERVTQPAVQTEEAPVKSQPPTLLIFKDGHQVEVENYAIVGDTLFDLSDGRRKKIALAELDLSATAKQNDDRGIDFQLPAGFEN